MGFWKKWEALECLISTNSYCISFNEADPTGPVYTLSIYYLTSPQIN
jgi:hypothetical protein